MSMLMVDGIPIAEIDPSDARFLIELARKGIGTLAKPLELVPYEERCRDLDLLAQGTLTMRERTASADVSFALRFTHVSERIENTVLRRA